jgi:ubiquinone/menaquinone biosynthesis C-methylase UbiE
MLPIYDPMLAVILRLWAVLGSPDFDDELLARAGIQPGHRVLDVGCGTGRLAVRAQQEYPQATVVGFDPDPAALARARAKAQARGVQVRFDRAYADALPYPNASFDRLLCSLMIRLLAGDERRNAFTEMRRVLTPTGSVHVVDFVAGEDVAAGLQQAGFTSGTLTRLKHRLAPRMAIIDARP